MSYRTVNFAEWAWRTGREDAFCHSGPGAETNVLVRRIRNAWRTEIAFHVPSV